MIAYTILNDAIARSSERACGYATDTDTPLLSELLQLSAAPDNNDIIHYRVFLVAALFLEQCPAVQTLLQAEDGVKFSQLVTAINSLRSLQLSYDKTKGLFVPIGFEALIVKTGNSLFLTTKSLPVKAVI
jgi:hypothetical protein